MQVFTASQAATLWLCNTQSASAADRICFLRQNPATVLCPWSLEHPLINPPSDHWWALCWWWAQGGLGRPESTQTPGWGAQQTSLSLASYKATLCFRFLVVRRGLGGGRENPKCVVFGFRPTQPKDLLPSEWGSDAEQQHQPDGV